MFSLVSSQPVFSQCICKYACIHVHIFCHTIQYTPPAIPKHYEQELKDIVKRDPLHPLYEQEKELIWKFR